MVRQQVQRGHAAGQGQEASTHIVIRCAVRHIKAATMILIVLVVMLINATPMPAVLSSAKRGIG